MDPQQGPPQPDLLIGQTIGNYLVTQKLGEGGMGSVYLAEHPTIGKKVALKVLHSEFSANPEITQRFFQEARAVNDIGHPNIVDVVDFGIIQAGPGREQLVYFIMEYLAGVTLSQLIRAEAPMPPERVLTICLQVADALSASHNTGIVHRDLKPDNIILLQRGRDRDFVKLLDFGIAKLTNDNVPTSQRTRTGLVMGTPAYMSPEQCEGRSSVGRGTDIYALGIVMYEMLTGRVPFVGEGYGEILVQHLTQRPTPVSQFRMLPAHVEAVVMKALEKRIEMRYPTMDEFMRAMSDPVGYVEAHGGIPGFLQRQLMPSTAPLPSARLTPAPLTPLPGTLIAPTHPSSSNLSTPVPTTLGAATGQVGGGSSKTGFIVAGLAVVAAAIVAIVIVARGGDHKGLAATGSGSSLVGSGSDTGSAVADSGSAAGSAVVPTIAIDASVDAAIDASAGSDSHAAGSDAHAGSDSGSAAGSDTGSATLMSTVDIEIDSQPQGARIFVDGADSGKATPSTLSFPRLKGKKLAIALRLKGYVSAAFKVDAGESSQQRVELAKIKTGPTPTSNNSHPTGTTPKQPPPGSGDPDGLMRP